MALDLTQIVIILTYISILLEIIIFPVPSVASSYQLIKQKKSLPEGFFYKRIQNLNLWQKVILLALPTLLSIIAYCAPLILIILSEFSNIPVYKTENAWLKFIAFIFILAGRAISVYSTISIRRNNRQIGKSFELKTGSLFSVSRNPILLGLYVSYVGMIILFPYFFMLIAFGYYILHMHFRILIEESFLRYKFGDKYVNYMGRTKRYI